MALEELAGTLGSQFGAILVSFQALQTHSHVLLFQVLYHQHGLPSSYTLSVMLKYTCMRKVMKSEGGGYLCVYSLKVYIHEWTVIVSIVRLTIPILTTVKVQISA